jgi:antitoxin (DNA-binding transcriptional repressor) of toxin-antitoxin stability system
MSVFTLEDAQARLPELIEKLSPGENVIITRNDQPIARLISELGAAPQAVFGRGRGKVVVVSDDDEHLNDFGDYMP